MSDRRQFLRNLVTLPLIGGGVTLIGAPSAPVPLVQAAAVPGIGDPRQRARYAWEAFAGAMGDLAAGADGWLVTGGARVMPIPHYRLDVSEWVRPALITYIYEGTSDPLRPAVFERRREVVL